MFLVKNACQDTITSAVWWPAICSSYLQPYRLSRAFRRTSDDWFTSIPTFTTWINPSRAQSSPSSSFIPHNEACWQSPVILLSFVRTYPSSYYGCHVTDSQIYRRSATKLYPIFLGDMKRFFYPISFLLAYKHWIIASIRLHQRGEVAAIIYGYRQTNGPPWSSYAFEAHDM